MVEPLSSIEVPLNVDLCLQLDRKVKLSIKDRSLEITSCCWSGSLCLPAHRGGSLLGSNSSRAHRMSASMSAQNVIVA